MSTKTEQILLGVIGVCHSLEKLKATPAVIRTLVPAVYFWKYLSDGFGPRRLELPRGRRSASGARGGAHQPTFTIPAGCDFDHITTYTAAQGLGLAIDNALGRIAKSNPDLKDIFPPKEFANAQGSGTPGLGTEILRHLMWGFRADWADFRQADSVHVQSIAEAFEGLIAYLPSGHAVPGAPGPQVRELMARMLIPSPKGIAYDPNCRFGAMLFDMAQKIAPPRTADTAVIPAFAGDDPFLQGMNSILHGQMPTQHQTTGPKRHIQSESPAPTTGPAKLSLTEYMVQTARQGRGQVAAVIAQGALFRQGLEADLRKEIITKNLLSCVIGLPGYAARTPGIRTAILIFDQNRMKDKDDEVLFVDAGAVEQGRRRFRENELARIVRTYRERAPVPGYSYVAKRDEIERNDFELSIRRYVRPATEGAEADVTSEQLMKEITEVEEELARTQNELRSLLRESALGSSLSTGDAQPSQDTQRCL